jgi:5-methylcytosine-specific restriction protein A
MGRLKALTPQIGSLAPRIGYMPGDEKAQDRSRSQLAPWRAWYRTARWQSLRQAVLLRDLYTCRMCGRIGVTGMVVDHIKPHRGSECLFWDEGNLQVLCASPCHSKHKQAQERAER